MQSIFPFNLCLIHRIHKFNDIHIIFIIYYMKLLENHIIILASPE